MSDENPFCPEHSGLVERLQQHERRLDDGKERMDRIDESLRTLSNHVAKLPSWRIVTVLVALLAIAVSALAGLLAALPK